MRSSDVTSCMSSSFPLHGHLGADSVTLCLMATNLLEEQQVLLKSVTQFCCCSSQNCTDLESRRVWPLRLKQEKKKMIIKNAFRSLVVLSEIVKIKSLLGIILAFNQVSALSLETGRNTSSVLWSNCFRTPPEPAMACSFLHPANKTPSFVILPGTLEMLRSPLTDSSTQRAGSSSDFH